MKVFLERAALTAASNGRPSVASSSSSQGIGMGLLRRNTNNGGGGFQSLPSSNTRSIFARSKTIATTSTRRDTNSSSIVPRMDSLSRTDTEGTDSNFGFGIEPDGGEYDDSAPGSKSASSALPNAALMVANAFGKPVKKTLGGSVAGVSGGAAAAAAAGVRRGSSMWAKLKNVTLEEVRATVKRRIPYNVVRATGERFLDASIAVSVKLCK